MMSDRLRQLELEQSVLETILGLGVVAPELKPKAQRIHRECLDQEIRPRLARQRFLLRKSLRGLSELNDEEFAAAVQRNFPMPSENHDAQLIALNKEITAAWESCVERLKAMWAEGVVQP